MTATSSTLRTTFVWQSVDERLGEEIIDFWQRHDALPTGETAQRRLTEIAVIARAESGGLAAVSSVQARHVDQLDHKFYSFRCFVAPAFRRSLLAARLISEVFEAFDARHADGANPDIIGMVAEVENVALNREHNQAVWPHSKFVFVGYDARGRHLRVRYFDGARVKSRI